MSYSSTFIWVVVVVVVFWIFSIRFPRAPLFIYNKNCLILSCLKANWDSIRSLNSEAFASLATCLSACF